MFNDRVMDVDISVIKTSYVKKNKFLIDLKIYFNKSNKQTNTYMHIAQNISR